jgi:ABC-type glycerol-3-phosphate transport system substrate-binding protein
MDWRGFRESRSRTHNERRLWRRPQRAGRLLRLCRVNRRPNPALEAAFTSYTNLVAKDRIAPLFPSSGTSSMSQANGRFVSGTVGMYVDGPWDLINVVGASKFQLGLAPIPAGKNGSVTLTAGSGFGIARSSPFKDAAWRAIQVLTGPEAETYLASQGRAFAARTDQQKYWYGVAAKNVVGAQPAFAAALKTALPYRTTPGWNTVSDLFEQYAPLAFGGQRQPDRVLKTIQQLSAEDW